MKIAIVGASGKLGSEVKRKLTDKYEVIEINRQDSVFGLPQPPDLIVDTSCAEQSVRSACYAASNNIPAVIACTGHNKDQLCLIESFASRVPIFLAYNMAYGAQVLKEAAAFIAEKFDSDIHIHEVHHKFKKDAPSGTAIELEKIFDGMNKPHSTTSARGGNVVGQHEICFYGEGETITLSHTAISREAFANGIEKACQFIITKPAGLYCMKDLTSSQELSL